MRSEFRRKWTVPGSWLLWGYSLLLINDCGLIEKKKSLSVLNGWTKTIPTFMHLLGDTVRDGRKEYFIEKSTFNRCCFLKQNKILIFQICESESYKIRNTVIVPEWRNKIWKQLKRKSLVMQGKRKHILEGRNVQ